ncbi:MAG2-interacting protein 2 [Forsythia ovata]|uniref:MAG2-interacting protein 2 n=1 Tax=Forsythia ovata TaxID=205694 RepID=A0ABD1X2D7_9LAMI
MEESVREVLFETRHHASRPYSSNYPPQQQLNKGGRGSLLSYLPIRGITQLKEKWSEYRQPRRLRRLASLFVTARGDQVAVASGNQITILQKDNDYQEPVGMFNSGNVGTFTCGTWSEAHEVLGVADDTDTLYFIKANGEEITRVTKRHLNASLPIVGLVVLDDTYTKKSCLCTFSVLISDGSMHDIEISKDPSASILSAHTLSSKQFPQNVFCLDYHPNLSLFALVSSAGDIQSTSNGNTGSCSVSLWRRNRNLDMEPVTFTQFEGLYSIPTAYHGQLTSPKVQLSPQGNFVATLDMQGHLLSFKYDEEKRSLSKLSFGKSYNSEVVIETSSSGTEFINDIVDFTWWSDNVLTVAKRNGTITMIGILTRVKLPENDLVYSVPLLERARQFPGHLFLLENISFEESNELSEHKGASLIEQVTIDKSNQFDFSRLQWNLVSFSEISVPAMYDKLITGQRYQAALDFADCHNLDKDEVLKSKWLSSGQGVNEIKTLLPTVKDQAFLLSECLERVGPTEDAQRALLTFGLRLTDSYRFSESEDDKSGKIWDFRMARLKLLLFRDRLETFLGINMGRFSVQEYNKFRNVPVREAALALAGDGKIGALNLLFKRHPYSLIPSMLEAFAAIPETIPVQTYGQLLPGTSAPSSIVLREEDWVECDKMAMFIQKLPKNHESRIQIRTEPIVLKCMEFQWPSTSELSSWYKERARDIDTLSGQLDNSMCLVDFACRKGIYELQQFLEDVTYLHQLIYSEDNVDEINFSMSLAAWEQLPDYEKFKVMLYGVKENNVISRLHKKAIPFMQRRIPSATTIPGDEVTVDHSTLDKLTDSFLVRWLKEIAGQHKLDTCLMIIEEGCWDIENNHFFKDEAEVVDCALQCVYLCSAVDRWSTMSAILSKLPRIQDFEAEDLKQRLKLAEGHVEAGRFLAYYQVPKPITFFLDAHSDVKGVKQIIRLLLSKFIRRQSGQSDNDWASMWRDLESLQEKAFPFLDLEYMLTEFCRALLKAGKFSLARNYLKGSSNVALTPDKAESLVIQAAREYFFSAPSLTCPEIWKAKECLNIFPSSRNVRAEADIVDALTVRLPNLGVNLLPMAFRQIKDPMEIIKLAITSQSGAYLNIDELVEIAKLLGLSAQEDISAVQEAIAREAAIAGDVQLAFDLCLVLAKKGHGSAWDLCVALARSHALESIDLKSQKLLLGFALSHCDEESISELLSKWKDLDMQDQCETLVMLTGREPSNFSLQGSSISGDLSGKVEVCFDDQVLQLNNVKSLLSLVAKNLSPENGYDWESVLREDGKLVSFAGLRLPWLLELSRDTEFGKKLTSSSVSRIHHVSVRMRAVMTILSWLSRNGYSPKDDLIASLAKSIMEPPVSEGEDIMGCSFLLNLVDAFHGVEIIEEQLRTRKNYDEFSSIMNVGMIYSLLHNYGIECKNPAERRELLLSKFREKHKSLGADERNKVHEAQSSFWKEWKVKLEEQKRVADKSRVLEQIIPGVETSRVLSGDMEYMQNVVFSLIESLKLEKKQIIKDVLELARTYGLDHTKVLLYYLNAILVSEVWTIDDVIAEVSGFKSELLACAGEAIKTISLCIYPAINGHDKRKLAFIFGLLSDCYIQLEESKELPPTVDKDVLNTNALWLACYYKVVEQECNRVSFIEGLNFKNIARLQDLNLDCFNDEVYAQIDENNVEALANMVENLVGFYGDTVPEGLLSGKSVYRHHILSLSTTLKSKAERETRIESFEDLHLFLSELENTYDICSKYLRFIEYHDVLDIVKQFFTVILPINESRRKFGDPIEQECLIMLLNFWLRLMNDMEDFASLDIPDERWCSKCSMTCFKVFLSLLTQGKLSSIQGWDTIISYVSYGLRGGVDVETLNFCRAMIFSRCGFEAVSHIFSELAAQFPPVNFHDLPNLYLTILETVLQELACGPLNRQNLNFILLSLSKLEGDLEDLHKVRCAVWNRMVIFSENLQLPSHVRLYALEVMQLISGGRRNSEVFCSEPPAHVLPWEGWDDLQEGRTANHKKTSDDPMVQDASSRFTNTLVALKSSQLLSTISPNLEIMPENLLTVESAVSSFLKLSESATTESHVNTLVAVLSEWEGLFKNGVDEEGESAEVSDAGNNWNNDDWDEGWESFQEESIEKETKKENSSLSIHPLHICWTMIFRKLVMLSQYRDVLKLIDQYRVKSCDILLLDEDDARTLITQIAPEVDCFLALKMALMQPYITIQLQCLDAVENILKERGIPDNKVVRDYELFVLVLSSGILSTIVTKSSYGTTFSCLCYMVGNFCRQWQETAQPIECRKNREANFDFLFVKLLFPFFIAELVKAEQQILAGFLVTRFMHTNASLSLINISEASLRRYLESQLQVLQEKVLSSGENDVFCEPLSNTITNLGPKLVNVIQSALSLLPTNNVR